MHSGAIDPFGSLSRLKQHVIGKQTRDDHGAIMNTMIRFFSATCEAEQKQAMAIEISEFDERLLAFGRLFRERFMNNNVSIPLKQALDLCCKTLAECFQENELLMKFILTFSCSSSAIAPFVTTKTHPDDVWHTVFLLAAGQQMLSL